MRSHHVLLFLLLCLAAASDLAAADKTDILILRNGDRITGEVISLEAGLLTFNTDAMGKVKIEWRLVRDLISTKTNTVETASGDLWVGKLEVPERGDGLQVNTFRGTVQLASEEVVSAWPVEAGFLDRMNLDVSAGLDFANSTGITDINIAADFSHRTEDRYTEASWRTDVTQQDNAEDQNREELQVSHRVTLPDWKYRTWLASAEGNNALDLDLRVTAGGGIGRYLTKVNRQWFSLEAGLVANSEKYAGADQVFSTELYGGLHYNYFNYGSPERTLDIFFAVLPSLSEAGRVRSMLRTTFKLELVTDLFWSMELYGSHDNEPRVEDAEKSDYGVTTSVGYSF